MKPLVLEPTTTAQWYTLLQEAEQNCAIQLHPEIENYLILLLNRFTQETDFIQKVMGLEYLKGLHEFGEQRQLSLRDVGDQCLIITGLFPGRAEKRCVKISYFIDIGQNAYAQLAQNSSHGLGILFYQLYEQFIAAMDVLQATRELSDKSASLTALQAAELWHDTHSRHAFEVLQHYTAALPLHIQYHDFDKKH